MSKARYTYAFLLLVTLIILIPAERVFAQAPPPATAPPPPPKYEGKAELAFLGTSGNTSTQTIGWGVEHLQRPGKWDVGTKVAYVRTKSEALLSAQSLALGVSSARVLTLRTSLVARYAFLRDEFAGTEHRHGFEGGVTVKLANRPRQIFTAEATAGYANEARVVGPVVTGGTVAATAKYTGKLSETADVTEELKIESLVVGDHNKRVANAVALTAKLSTVFALKVSNTVRYANKPPVGFKTTDTITSITLVAKY